MAPRARNAPVETEGGCEVLKVCADCEVAFPEDDPTWALKQIDYIGEGGTIVSVMNRPRVLAQAVPSRQIILDLVHEPLELVPPDHQL